MQSNQNKIMKHPSQGKVCCIPGLGLDGRIFSRIDFGRWQPEVLEWIEPQGHENLATYAGRMSDVIDDEQPLTIIGYSFGGIIAQELAAIRPVKKIILVSSIKGRSELSPWFRRIAPWGLSRLFFKPLMLTMLPLWGRNHGLDRSEIAFFRSMLERLSEHYFRWGLSSISSWREPVLPEGTQVIHIHGTMDRPFPHQYLGHVDHVIPHGDHLMIWKRSEEITRLVSAGLEC